MKILRPLFFSLFLVLSLGGLKAQDIHFTMYNMSPLTLNPALAGAYYGTARVGGIYRDQWASFLPNQYTTPAFFIDAPIVRGFRKNDWVGIGIVTINDKAGTSRLRTQGSLLTAAYHASLDKAGKNVLTLGVQAGSMTRRLDQQRLIFSDEFDPLTLDRNNPSQDSDLAEKKSYLDINAGLLLRAAVDEKNNVEVGLTVGHIPQSEYNLITAGAGQDDNKRPMTIRAHGRWKRQVNDQWSVTPSFIGQTTKGTWEIGVQALAGYQINEDIELLAGPGYRLGDAFEIMVGAQINDLRVGLAYDFNISSLSKASNTLGGFELGAYYIIKLYQKPNVTQAVICPEF